MIPYGKHSIDKTDIDAVIEVIENQFLTQGTQVPAFEQALCSYTGASFATAVNSGTSGLHVACLALGVVKGDLVWTTPNSFAASANCVLYCGADVDFVDINPLSRNICPGLLEQKLHKAHADKRIPKALVVVHFAGLSCDMEAIHSLCKKFSVRLIEDAAHGLGGDYKESKIGGCEYSDISVVSFHPVKSITTAEGGAVLTNDPEIAQRAALFAKHGITRDDELMQGESHGPWYYQQLHLGYNYRMSDLHAALGISQLKRIDKFIAERKRLAKRYLLGLAELPLIMPYDHKVAIEQSAWHLFMIELTQHDRAEIFEKLTKLGIAVNVHYIPIHLHPYYQQLGFTPTQFPASVKFYENALTLPLYVGLSDEEQDTVISALVKLLS
jgi:UDP-4-amino-4,6-dideoxy-N-acetyl-beta-L-altrosamine transaminase